MPHVLQFFAAKKDHLPTMLKIEEGAEPGDQWGVGDFAIVAAEPSARMRVAVAEVNGFRQIVAYVAYVRMKRKIALLRLAVDKKYRGQGIGSSVICRLANTLSKSQTHVATIVRESNLPAQKFLRSVGFNAIRVKRALYEDTGEDGYLMVAGASAILEGCNSERAEQDQAASAIDG